MTTWTALPVPLPRRGQGLNFPDDFPNPAGAASAPGGSDTARTASGTGRSAGRGSAPRRSRPATSP